MITLSKRLTNFITRKKAYLSKGFTLVEIIIVVAISAMIASVVVFGYRSYLNKLAVSAGTQDIVLALREAQTYGVSVKQSAVGSGNFSAGYGVYFNAQQNNASYILFTDANNDGIYNGNFCSTGGDCPIQINTLRNNVRVKLICGVNALGQKLCPPSGAQGVSIVFVRPNPDALLHFSNPGQNILPGTYSSVDIVITSSTNIVSTTTIDSTGRISTY